MQEVIRFSRTSNEKSRIGGVYVEKVPKEGGLEGRKVVTIGILLDLRDRCITGTVVRY